MELKVEKLLKSCLKRKMSLNLATVVAFLLSFGMAAATDVSITEAGKLTISVNENNQIKEKDITEKAKNESVVLENKVLTNNRNLGNHKLINNMEGLSLVNNSIMQVNSYYSGLVSNKNLKEVANNGRLHLNSAKNIDKITNNGVMILEGVRDSFYNLIYSTILINPAVKEIENRGYIKGYVKSLDKLVNKGEISGIHYSYIVPLSKNIENEGIIFDPIELEDVNAKIINKGYIYGLSKKLDLDAEMRQAVYTNYGIITNPTYKFIENKGIMAGNVYDGEPVVVDGKTVVNEKPIINGEIKNQIVNFRYGHDLTENTVIENSIYNTFDDNIEIRQGNLTVKNSIINADIYSNSSNNIKNLISIKDNSIINGKISQYYGDLELDTTVRLNEGVNNDFETRIVPNETDKNATLFLNNNITSNSTKVSAKVKALTGQSFGKLTVENGGELVLADASYLRNSNENVKRDIEIADGGKILIDFDPLENPTKVAIGKGYRLKKEYGQDATNSKKNADLKVDAVSLLHDLKVDDNFYELSIVGRPELPVIEKPTTPTEVKPTPEPTTPITPTNPSTGTGETGTTTPVNPEPVEPEPVDPTPAEPEVVPADYTALNTVYKSIYESGQLNKFAVNNEDSLKGLYKYLRDIHAANPYAAATGNAANVVAMFRDNVGADLNAANGAWSAVAGTVSSNGGNKYVAKTSNGFAGAEPEDPMNRAIPSTIEYQTTGAMPRVNVDTKSAGAYMKGEYGLSDTAVLGVVVGGANTKTTMATGKVESTSAYIEAYGKKYVDKFRFTLGTGLHFGDNEGERKATGYAGVTESRTYKAKYKDKGMDIYGEVNYVKDLGNNLFVEPKVKMAFTHIKQDKIKENSAPLSMEIKSKSFNTTTAGLGVDLKKVITTQKANHTLGVGLEQEFMLSGSKATTLKASMNGGAEFDVLVPEKEKGRTTLGALYSLESEKGLLLDAKIDYDFKRGNNKSKVKTSFGIGYKF